MRFVSDLSFAVWDLKFNVINLKNGVISVGAASSRD
jgi:hypothetical protein